MLPLVGFEIFLLADALTQRSVANDELRSTVMMQHTKKVANMEPFIL